MRLPTFLSFLLILLCVQAQQPLEDIPFKANTSYGKINLSSTIPQKKTLPEVDAETLRGEEIERGPDYQY